MNVTDIDDKIVRRIRQNHSVKKFRGESQAFSPALVNELAPATDWDAWAALAQKFQDKSWKAEVVEAGREARTHTALAVALELLASGSHDEHFAHSHPWTPGTARVVTDPFTSWSLAAYWEGQFVRDPDALTRATESVSETVDFVACIVQNGYAYEHEARI
ncbi:hypothetical protein FA95DRAFT_1610580 [Auriscalpium vulgare]|uniref:Uncharacterized protein n=1 Tax=Auriscalpium vulgare TaxID=40419 RepID=A0ACB8RCR7_9AGAM|nr:hypothetical protein FA95DRAFT_1610580 [Auriscalpium vulgare]